MKIRLSEIPEDGKNYVLNRKTGEITGLLADLIGEQPYQAEVFLRPMNSRDFELSGTIKTQAPASCSRCAEDMNFQINKTLREVLIPKQDLDKTGKYSKPNHVLEHYSESAVDVIEVENEVFDLGEYLHETIALAIPFNPAPPVDSNNSCGLCFKQVKAEAFIYDEPMEVEKESPFSVLKKLKLN